MIQGLPNLDSVGNSVHPYCLERVWIISRPNPLVFCALVIKITPSPFSYAKRKATNPAFTPAAKNTDWDHFPRSQSRGHRILEPAVTSDEPSIATISPRACRLRRPGWPKQTALDLKGSSTGLRRPSRGRCAGLPRSHSHLYRRTLPLGDVVSQEWVVETCCAPYAAAAVLFPASILGIARLSRLSISAE